ncbi:MAG: serine hydrolase [Acidobacteriota bacterium]
MCSLRFAKPRIPAPGTSRRSTFRRGTFRSGPVSTAFFLILLLALAPAALAESPFDGRWEGAIAVPGSPLAIDIDLESDADGALSGDISIPVQGIVDLPLENFESEGAAVSFVIPGIPGEPTFNGELADDGMELAGTFTQGGAELSFSLDRDGAADEAAAALDGFAEVVEKAVADFNVPGVGLAVVRGGEVVFAEGFGFRDVEKELPMTADSLFAIGSTTKAMVATVLAMQAEEGLLDWDEPLVRHIPSFRLEDPMVTARVSPRDLVTHRTGLPRHDMLWYNAEGVGRASLIDRFEHLELTADLRERWQYNNLMFVTAGYLSGQLDGRRWEETVRARLFEPLGMERSNFSVETSKTDPDHALPYRENDDDALERIPFRNIDLAGPAGSVNSSVREMAKWLAFNLSGGMAGGTRLLEASSLADVHAPHMTFASGPSPESRVSQQAYGMGWGVEVYRGHRRIQHGGGIDGFITAVSLYPDDDLGIVAFTNRGSGLPGLLSSTVADRVLGLEPVDWIGDALARMEAGEAELAEAEEKAEAAKVDGTQPSRALAEYVGDYGHPGYGTVEVELVDDALSFTFNGIDAPLEHWHYDVFKAGRGDDPVFEDTRLQFRGNFDGRISEVLIPFELSASPIIFEKQPSGELTDPEYLARFVGRYALSGQVVSVTLSGEALSLHVPGQPVYTLRPDDSGRFYLKGLQGFSLAFEEADGVATKAIFYQPNGVFESTRVKE